MICKSIERVGCALALWAAACSLHDRLTLVMRPAACRARTSTHMHTKHTNPQARDEDNNPRLSGSDTFHVTLLRDSSPGDSSSPVADSAAAGSAAAAAAGLLALPAAGQSAPGQQPPGGGQPAGGAQPPGGTQPLGGHYEAPAGSGGLAVVSAARVIDSGDGSYRVTYRLEGAGRYLIAVTDGESHASVPVHC